MDFSRKSMISTKYTHLSEPGSSSEIPEMTGSRPRVAAAEARYSDEAIDAALQTPRAPFLTGIDAWSHWISFKEQLAIIPLILHC